MSHLKYKEIKIQGVNWGLIKTETINGNFPVRIH